MAALLDLTAAAQRIGLSSRTIRDWIWRSGAGLDLTPAAAAFVDRLQRVGSRWRIAEADLDAWLATQRRGIRHPPADLDRLELRHQAEALAVRARAAGADLAAEALSLGCRLLGEDGGGAG